MTLVVCTDHDTPVPRADRSSSNVIAVSGLCSDPSKLADAGVRDPEALVLHAGEFDLGFMQGAIRETGKDPLSVPIVALGDMPSLEQVEILAAGAVARHASFDRTRPEHSKIRWPEFVSRCRFFSLNVPQYVGVPSINTSLCAAEHGCRLCVDACPPCALTWNPGGIAHDVDACVACGICITACPTAATENPAVAEKQISAQITSMVDTAVEAIGIEFRCRDARPRMPVDGWFPVEVPCTGMLTIGWLIAPLVLGAGAVAAPTCGDSGCSIGNDGALVPRRVTARKLLDELGLYAGSVRDTAGGAIPEPISTDTTRCLGTLRDTEVFLALADVAHTAEGRLSSEATHTGIVRLDAATCTVCQECIAACPSGALTTELFGGVMEISFDPFACTGCALCVEACPEVENDAITLDHRLDAAELTFGSRVILSLPVSTRRMRHNSMISPAAIVDRARSMLGSGYTDVVDITSQHCLNRR